MGTLSILSGNKIINLLRQGSTEEDSPICRASNHFHDPLKLWGFSAMTDVWSAGTLCRSDGWIPTYSNVTWATGFLDPAPGGQKQAFTTNSATMPYTWDKARTDYYAALTSTATTAREPKFADTFKTLGHVLHLLQDVAVPAHTRNDFLSHLVLDPVYGIVQPYENFVKINTSLINNADHSGNSPTFPGPVVTKYWDTDQYNGSNPSGSTSIGLAEYSNANFFSDTTIFRGALDQLHSFPYPAWSGAQDYEEIVDGSTGKKRTYLKKVGDGETVDHLASAKWFYKYLPAPVKNTGLQLDDKCHEDYARKLLPRAIGYSAALLNYFFRGTIEITAPSRYVYGIIDGSVVPQQFKQLKAKIRNTTTGEAMGNGIIHAVAKYKKRIDYMPDLSADPPSAASREEDFSYSVSAPMAIASLSATTPAEFIFDFSNSPIPAGITDLYLHVVFKGTLGNEENNAVAVGMKNLMEPMHHVFWNLTDMFSLNGHLYTADQIRSDPDLTDFVDHDDDGYLNETMEGEAYIDPYNVDFMIGYYGAYPPTGLIFSATVDQLPPGRYIRLISIVDKLANNYLRMRWDNAIYSPDYLDFIIAGVQNEEVDGLFYPTGVLNFRSRNEHFWQGVLGCDPMSGPNACAYPENEAIPANLTPYPAVITP